MERQLVAVSAVVSLFSSLGGMMMHSFRTSLHARFAIGTTLASALTAVALVALSAGAPSSLAAVHHGTTGYKSHFAVFRSSNGTSGPALPAGPTSALSGTSRFAVSVGPDIAAATYVSVSPALDLWVVPGSAGACLVGRVNRTPPNLLVCASSGQVLAGRLRATLLGPNSTPNAAFGLVPNSTASVTAVAADGSQASVPVIDNAYYVATPFTRLLMTSSTGTTTDLVG
jgi:hypothetical protein